MFSVRIIGVIVAVGSVIIAYFMGVAAGRKEAFEQGKREGAREGSVRAYAVGYDRGKRASQEEQQAESEPPENQDRKTYGCLLILLVLITSVILLLGFASTWK